jgi:hypothetical protein
MQFGNNTQGLPPNPPQPDTASAILDGLARILQQNREVDAATPAIRHPRDSQTGMTRLLKSLQSALLMASTPPNADTAVVAPNPDYKNYLELQKSMTETELEFALTSKRRCNHRIDEPKAAALYSFHLIDLNNPTEGPKRFSIFLCAPKPIAPPTMLEEAGPEYVELLAQTQHLSRAEVDSFYTKRIGVARDIYELKRQISNFGHELDFVFGPYSELGQRCREMQLVLEDKMDFLQARALSDNRFIPLLLTLIDTKTALYLKSCHHSTHPSERCYLDYAAVLRDLEECGMPSIPIPATNCFLAHPSTQSSGQFQMQGRRQPPQPQELGSPCPFCRQLQ